MRAWMWVLLSGCFTQTELEVALDRDGDGYQPVVAGGPDCDETRADVNPGAPELCGDGIDNDCDGRIDDVGVGERLWYLDTDGDGYGIDQTVSACTEPEGYAPVPGDCADDDAGINPGVEDLCDGIDQDCDGRIDDDVDALVQFRDADGDGFGVDSDTVTGCGLTPGYVLASGDCDDGVASINPAAEDGCDGVDQNCNGVVDDDVVYTVQYRDADGDGDGNPGEPITACEVLSGYVAAAADCDDQDPTRHSNAVDFCDYIDQDCDGLIDDDAVFLLYYPDVDGDGAGADDAGVLDSCEPLEGFASVGGDCDDMDPTRSPLLVDGCDGIDTDCDGFIDDDALLTLYFPDADEDGVGTTVGAVEACIPPAGFVQLSGDCDDEDPTVRPGAVDGCDGIDVDCDGAVDEDAEFLLWWVDADGDGVGAGTPTLRCEPLVGGSQLGGDCDDGDDGIRPGQIDGCDGVDQDCDGAVDEGAVFRVWFRDADGDGVGDTEDFLQACGGAPSGYVAAAGDCDDGDASVIVPAWFRDADGDGWGTTETRSVCVQPAGFAASTGDCDDGDALRNPGLAEICNNRRDDDCDATTDCRRLGSLSFSTPDLEFSLPLDGREYRLVPSLTGDASWDWIASAGGDVSLYDGDDPDLSGGGVSTWSDCIFSGPLPVIADVTGDNVPDIVCEDPYLSQIRSGADPSGPVAATVDSAVPIRQIGAYGNGLLVRTDDGLSYLDSRSGALTTSAAAMTIVDPRISSAVEVVDAMGSQSLLLGTRGNGDATFHLFREMPSGTTPIGTADETFHVVELVGEFASVGSIPLSNGMDPWLSSGCFWSTDPVNGTACLTFDPGAPSVPHLWDAPTMNAGANGEGFVMPVGDVDGDGFIDWVHLRFYAIGVNQSSLVYGIDSAFQSTSQPSVDLGIGSSDRRLLIGDLSGDGRADLLEVSDMDGLVRVLLGSGI